MKKSALSVGKRLQVSLLLPLAILGLGCNKANAEDIYAPVPTLTKLHNEGATIPDTNPPMVYPQSAYTITNGTATDYNFTTQTYDNNGNLTTNYYKINLDLNGISPEGLTWTEVSGAGENTVQINLPNNEVKYYKYAFNENNSNVGVAIFNSHKTIDDDIHYDFINNQAAGGSGGAIFNYDTEMGNIYGNFIGNYASSSGGAIFNSDTKMGNIYGNFIGNYISDSSSMGGAIFSKNSTIGNITGDFIGNHIDNGGTGGAIHNRNNSQIGIITGDFIGNYTEGSSGEGGAIFNYQSLIQEIHGNFVENKVISARGAQGGAIYNFGDVIYPGEIGNFYGDFIGNHVIATNTNSLATAEGGALYNTSNIGNIIGNFIGNYANSNGGLAKGGAICNESASQIQNIKGDFVDNHAYSENSSAQGGALYNTSNIGNIIGNFNNNYVQGAKHSSSGGAIFNGYDSSINDIIGDFKDNYSITNKGSNTELLASSGAIYNSGNINNIEGNFIRNRALSYDEDRSNSAVRGGAISNYGKINNIINSNFYENYTYTDLATGKARGGAIFTNKNLDIISDNNNSTFKGNYVQSGNNEKDYQAIYADNYQVIHGDTVYNINPTLTLKSVNGGQMYMYDNINGTDGYKVHITGDNTGTLHLYNDIKNANITTDNTTIDTINSNIHDYSFKTLNSDESTLYNIDIDLANNGSADSITTTEASEGIVTLNKFNILNPEVQEGQEYKIQILDTQEDNLQLKLGENISDKEIVLKNTTENVKDEVTKDVKWNDKFEKYTLNTSVVGNVTLDTTTTTNDSIKLTATDTKTTKTDVGSLGDTLALVNQLETTEDRSFTFDTANDKYNVSSDLGKTTAGQLSINGVSDTTEGTASRSEINLNGHNGFELDNETTLNVNDTRLTGNDTLITVSNQNAAVNLKNADLNGSIAAENSYSLNITGDTFDRTIINGEVGKANATHSGGELGFNTDTFKDAEFSTVSGTVDLVTGQVENYDIGKLTSDESSNWIFEIDSSGSGADTLTVGTGSNGTVNVSKVNFVNGDSPSDEFTVKLLNAGDDNIQLAVDPSIAGENHKLGTVTKTSQDTVTPTAKWNQTFNKYTQTGTNYGNIDVATTNTTNDSLQLKVTNTEWDEKTISGSMGDTLVLVNQLETEENRNFNFDSANNVYEVKSDLGTTTEGKMNVNGVKSGETRSTINGNNYNMFALSNPTTLNLNNVKIQGANSVASGTNKNAVINMNSVELKNNASGITTAGSVNISGKSLFENNGNGIEVTDENSIITLNGLDGEGYDVTFKDKLKGVSGAKLNLKAGQVEFHKSVTDLDINMAGTTANLASDSVFNGQNLTVASASNINMINNSVGTMQLNSLTLNDNMNLGVDVDLANKSMDRISANTYNLGEHKVNVNKMNLLSDAKEVRTDIEFADEQLRNNVTTSVSEVAYSPIYKYGVKYNKNNGEFQFTRSNSGGGGGDDPQPQPAYNDLNPAIMASPVAAQLGGYAGMLDNYGNALNHMDMYMLKPKKLRAAELNANKYAIADGSPARYYSNETNSNGIWVRPYTSYDSVGLKHGPKVHNLSYGSFVGGDFGMHDFGNGLYGEFSPYISYQGAHQSYSGNSVYQNGGTLGFAGTLYKGNFFTGLTAGVGANVTEASTMYGHEDFPMLYTGVASKTGYNIEFKEGKFIIQPSLLVSYTFVNTFDYTNAAGVRIDTSPLHAVQINPNIRFSFNTKNYWQPYAFVGMNWNIMSSGHFKAADTTLPELSMKPYIQYGLGIQKLFSDNFTAFAQVAIRNGGRNGVGGTVGLKWIFGRQPQKQQEQKQKNVL